MNSQDAFFRRTAKQAVSRVANGENASIMIYGPSKYGFFWIDNEFWIWIFKAKNIQLNLKYLNRSGKTFTFTGGEKQQKGLMFRCVDELL